MKYLGIDFGSKRIGLAVSDDGGKLAFPHSVVPNGANLLEEIKEAEQEIAEVKKKVRNKAEAEEEEEEQAKVGKEVLKKVGEKAEKLGEEE